MHATNYIRVIGRNERPRDGEVLFFNDKDLGEVSRAVEAAKARIARLGGGRITSFHPVGDPAVEVVGVVREPPAIKAEAGVA